jgi:bacillithiol biosynthesis cysteine-adding enzyme BshC
MGSLASANDWQLAWQAGDPRVSAFYHGPCCQWEAGVRPAGAGAWVPLTDDDLAEWRALLPGRGPLPELDALRDPETLVVITGQQAGAALGPLYVLYKAMAARRWADRVASVTGRRTVALFWVASDDHDLDEVRRAVWLTKEGELRRQDLATPGALGHRSVWREPIHSPAAEQLIADLAAGTTASEFQPVILRALEEAHRPGATFESAFLDLFCRWLLPLGIIPLVPRLGFIRRRAVPVLEREVDAFVETNRQVQQAGEAIRTLGPAPLLHRKGHELNFFVDVGEIRARLHAQPGGRMAAVGPGGESVASWSAAELKQLLAEEPGRFSPNAILRPLVQDAALPTVAYVGGPGEILYHAQLGGLYERFGVHRAALLPRPRVLLLDARAERSAAKLGLTPEQLSDPESLQAAATDQAALGEFAARTARLREEAAALSEWLGANARETGVQRSAEKLQQAIDGGLDRLSERVTQHLATRDADRARHVERLRSTVVPGGEPQERVISSLSPLLIQYGPDTLAAILTRLEIESSTLQVLPLSRLAANKDD